MKYFITTFVSLALCANIAFAGSAKFGPKHKRFGAGIIAGEPTGLSMKGYLAKQLSLDAIAAWSFNDKAFTIIGDALYDIFDIKIDESRITLPFYAGGGARIAVKSDKRGNNDTIFGVRVPVGVAVQWEKYPVEVFGEIAPGIDMVPSTGFDLSGGVGVRYYFF